MHPLRHPGTRFLAAIAACLLALVGLAAPAQAVGQCGDSESDFVTREGCTSTGVVKAHGSLLTKDDLYRNIDVYESWGFSRDWIARAPTITVTVAPGIDWIGCDDNGVDGLCRADQGETLSEHYLSSLFEVGTPITVIGTPDKWIALMCGNFHPVLTPPTDVAKTGFTLVDAPQRIDADTDATLTIAATLLDNGPATAPTTVTDHVTVTGPQDCTITPATQEVTRTLHLGRPETVQVQVRVRCTEPSHHTFRFTDRLDPEAGRLDPDMSNNEAAFEHTIEVFDDSDIAVTDPRLECADETEVGDSFSCTGRATVTNGGPFGPTRVDATLALQAPEDCTVTPAGGANLDDHWLAVGANAGLDRTWTLVCTRRSFHPITLTASARPDHLHVEDHATGNNETTAATVTEVFEDVDLEAQLVDLRCTEREANTTSSACTATITVTNNGPATEVITETDVAFTVEDGCVVNPAGTQTETVTLDAGESVTFTTAVRITCATARRHAVSVSATLHNSPRDPHAVDSDTVTGTWGPTDVKPRSFPSSVNPRKEGLIPFAILGTSSFDPLTEVDIASIRFGVSGTETSVVRCATGGEDVNDDGILDLVCQAETKVTGVSCTTTVLQVRALLRDGTPLFGQDEVNVVGCRR